MTVLLSTAYWPNLHYFYYIFNAETIIVEKYEHYQKQSYRNRTQILTANGVLNLSIPVLNANKQLITDVEIGYAENWQKQHWRAIESAYKNSPYFEFFETDIKQFYSTKFDNLFDYNLKQLHLILKLLKQSKEINFTEVFKMDINPTSDLRQTIHPKINFKNDELVKQILTKTYYQTFETKFEFNPNLSILDALFNLGLESYDILKT